MVRFGDGNLGRRILEEIAILARRVGASRPTESPTNFNSWEEGSASDIDSSSSESRLEFSSESEYESSSEAPGERESTPWLG